jgi:hypothetical protein
MCVRCGTGAVAWCTSPDRHAGEELADLAVTIRTLELKLMSLGWQLASGLAADGARRRAGSLASEAKDLADEVAVRAERVKDSVEAATGE